MTLMSRWASWKQNGLHVTRDGYRAAPLHWWGWLTTWLPFVRTKWVFWTPKATKGMARAAVLSGKGAALFNQNRWVR